MSDVEVPIKMLKCMTYKEKECRSRCHIIVADYWALMTTPCLIIGHCNEDGVVVPRDKMVQWKLKR